MGKKRSEDSDKKNIVIIAPPRKEGVNLGELSMEEKFAVYRVWKALPITMLRKMTRDEIYTNVGIDDPALLDLTDIHTQTEFSTAYVVDEDTLTAWNKKIFGEDPFAEARVWSAHLVKNLIMSLYMKAVRSGDPFRIELFFKAVNKWEEKSRIDVNYKGVTDFHIQQYQPKPIEEMKKEVEAIVTEKQNGTEQSNEHIVGYDKQTVGSIPLPARQ